MAALTHGWWVLVEQVFVGTLFLKVERGASLMRFQVTFTAVASVITD